MLKIFKPIGSWLIWLYKFIVQLLIMFITMILNINLKYTLLYIYACMIHLYMRQIAYC